MKKPTPKPTTSPAAPKKRDSGSSTSTPSPTGKPPSAKPPRASIVSGYL